MDTDVLERLVVHHDGSTAYFAWGMEAQNNDHPLQQETESIIGAAFEVLNTMGHGMLEKPYENALCTEFELRDIPFEQQPRYEVIYKGAIVGHYVPDLIAFNSVVVDAKVIERITDHEIGRMVNYLRITKLRVGLILNFKRARLEWKRVVL